MADLKQPRGRGVAFLVVDKNIRGKSIIKTDIITAVKWQKPEPSSFFARLAAIIFMDNKKFAVILIVVILALAGLSAGAYYFGVKIGKSRAQSSGSDKLHTAVTCIQDFALEQKKTDAGVITNPMQNLPETNPFNAVKTNPFQ